jgi:hypothetical protein
VQVVESSYIYKNPTEPHEVVLWLSSLGDLYITYHIKHRTFGLLIDRSPT